MRVLKEFKISNVKLNNRICIAPMCQYSAINGNPSKWHYSHLGRLMKLGAGLMIIESTAVSKRGKISKNDLTLENKKNFIEFKKLTHFLRKISSTKIGIQLSHSGRNGSKTVPWIKSNFPLKKGWETIAPSSIKRDKHWPFPKEMTKKDIKIVRENFISAANYSKKIGFDCLEIHMAHGYLLHQFFSPISNLRKDEYGGSLKNRCKFPIDIAKDVRKVWPKNKILGARITGYDWMDKKGSSVDDAVYLSNELKKIGLDYVCVSSGGIIPKTKVNKLKRGYQVFLAKKIKIKSKIIVKTTGMIKDIKHAEQIVKNKDADLVSFARKFINSPNWLIKELVKRNKKIEIPNQYKRCF